MKKLKINALLLLVFLSFSAKSQEWEQLGDRIIGHEYGDNSGYSIALSEDGHTVVIGEPTSDLTGPDAGLVKVMVWTGDTWEMKGEIIGGVEDNELAGWTVDINNEGNIIALSGIHVDGESY